jgi:ribonuclease PH
VPLALQDRNKVTMSSNLSNVYIPLPALYANRTLQPSHSSINEREKDPEDTTSRLPSALRPVQLDTGVLPNASVTGSASCRFGHTHVIAQVHAPVTPSSDLWPSNLTADMDQGVLHVSVSMMDQVAYPAHLLAAQASSTLDSASSVANTGSSSKVRLWMQKRESHLASRLHNALSPSVPLQGYPKCAILLTIIVLQDDGSILPASTTAASLAMMDAGVEMYNIVTATTVACISSTDASNQSDDLEYWVDPTLEEELRAQVLLTAAMNHQNEITLWEQSGRLSTSQIDKVSQICQQGHRTLVQCMRQHMKQKYDKEGTEKR